MAKTPPNQPDAEELPGYSEADKNKARQWFKKAEDLRQRQNHDYAVESYITGLGFWPEAIEEGLLPLWALAIQRQQAGGKKPSAIEKMKRGTGGKDTKQAMLNALYLLAKDPSSASAVDALLKAANRGNFHEVVKWAAERALDSMRKDKKLNVGRFKTYREALVQSAEWSDAHDDPAAAAWFYEKAVVAVEMLITRSPADMTLRDMQRDLSGKLTIAKGKYAEADSFRDSLQDGASQKLLHDAERAQQGDQTLRALVDAARKAWEAEPIAPKAINGYVEALLKSEREPDDNAAIEVLEKAHKQSSNYNYKLRADDVRIRMHARRTRALREKAAQSGSEEDKQQARLAAMDDLQTAADIFRERVSNYPTDLRMKAKLGEILFRLHEYEEAIPVLQAARNEPRSRTRCQLLIGKAFLETKNFTQAAETLQEAIENYDRDADEVAKDMMYHLGIALQEDGKIDEAKTAFGKLLRVDYNYADGDARQRHAALG